MSQLTPSDAQENLNQRLLAPGDQGFGKSDEVENQGKNDSLQRQTNDFQNLATNDE
jgi:hypothetical protein